MDKECVPFVRMSGGRSAISYPSVAWALILFIDIRRGQQWTARGRAGGRDATVQLSICSAKLARPLSLYRQTDGDLTQVHTCTVFMDIVFFTKSLQNSRM